MSELVNDVLKASLQEDLEDIKSWEERKGEDTYSYEEFVELLKIFQSCPIMLSKMFVTAMWKNMKLLE